MTAGIRAAIGGAALACLAAGLGASPAAAQERIRDFRSTIAVHADGSMTVTETISVFAAGRQIKRGIYREFPTTYKDRFGNTVRVGFDVVEVVRDGRPEPYFIRDASNGKRIYIGDENVFLSPGEYTYAITYDTDRQLGFFDDFDELYWNVTGNGWGFMIERARAVVELPPGARILDTIAYTGRQGATGRDVTMGRDARGNATFATTRALNPREGLTIVVSWPKGVVAEPSAMGKVGYLLSDNAMLLAVLAGLIVVLAYYLVVWAKVGRDPAEGTIVPLFSPPKGFSPAAVRYVMRMGYSDKVFAAAVVSMAVQGYLTIEESAGGEFTLIRTNAGQSALSPGEAKIARELFRGSRSQRIELENKNHSTIGGAVDALKASLKRDFEKIHFMRNAGYLAPGVLLTVLTIIAASVSGSPFLIAFTVAAGAIITFAFYYFLKAPTLTGRRVMDQIEGFKLYLSVAEKERLGVLHPPDKTPELFERYLPFALALDVENEWSEQFADVLAAAGRDTDGGYSPGWYSGSSWRSGGVRGFASSVGGSLAGAISSSSSPPGSSSGGGGGAGGGGGGGGGGGW